MNPREFFNFGFCNGILKTFLVSRLATVERAMSSTSGGGRDRDKNRKQDSGAAKHKAKEQRAARGSNVLSKVPKITALFRPKCADTSGETSDTGSSSIDALADVQSQHHDEVASGYESSTTMSGTIPATETKSLQHLTTFLIPIRVI